MKFTDFLLGKKLATKINAVGRMPLSEGKPFVHSREIKDSTRNRIMFLVVVSNTIVQILNFLFL